jgi:hypothetical protein
MLNHHGVSEDDVNVFLSDYKGYSSASISLVSSARDPISTSFDQANIRSVQSDATDILVLFLTSDLDFIHLISKNAPISQVNMSSQSHNAQAVVILCQNLRTVINFSFRLSIFHEH